MLDPGILWKVWFGNISSPALVVAPCDASINEVVGAGRLALHEYLNSTGRYGTEWVDKVAASDLQKVERCEDVYLQARFSLTAPRYPSCEKDQEDARSRWRTLEPTNEEDIGHGQDKVDESQTSPKKLPGLVEYKGRSAE